MLGSLYRALTIPLKSFLTRFMTAPFNRCLKYICISVPKNLLIGAVSGAIYIQFYEEVNLNELVKVRKAPTPAHKCPPQPPTNLRKSQNVAFPGDFALRVEKSNSKIIQKLKLPQKPKCTSKYPTSHSEKGSQ